MFFIANIQIDMVVLVNNYLGTVPMNWSPESDQFFNNSFKYIEHLDM